MTRRSWPVIAAVVLVFACGGGGTGHGETVLSDLVGSWHVTNWEYSLAADPAQKADWVTQMGLTGSLLIAGNGDFSVEPALPGGFGQDQGQLTLEGDSLYWDGENDEEWVHFTLASRTLTLLWPEVELVDMDENGEPEDVRLRVVLGRN